MFNIFYLAYTKGDLQKVARECTPTDHMQYIGGIFICQMHHEISALGTPRNNTQQKCLMVLVAKV